MNAYRNVVDIRAVIVDDKWVRLAKGFAVFLTAWAVLANTVRAQNPPGDAGSQQPAPEAQVPAEYATPKATVRTFLENIRKLAMDVDTATNPDPAVWEKVFTALDMPAASSSRKDTAWRLFAVFTGLELIDPETAEGATPNPDETEGTNSAELFPQSPPSPRFQAVLIELAPQEPPAKIVLVRTERASGSSRAMKRSRASTSYSTGSRIERRSTSTSRSTRLARSSARTSPTG